MAYYTVAALKARDEQAYDDFGGTKPVRVYTFFLSGDDGSKHGPFTERVDLKPFDEQEINRRIDVLKAHLGNVRA
jgi:hypothetical protein